MIKRRRGGVPARVETDVSDSATNMRIPRDEVQRINSLAAGEHGVYRARRLRVADGPGASQRKNIWSCMAAATLVRPPSEVTRTSVMTFVGYVSPSGVV